MTWVKLDVGFPDHPKILGLSDAAFRLHVRALCYASRHLTDGVLPRVWLPSGSRAAAAMTQLRDARLWDQEGENYRIHDYLGHQRSRGTVEKIRTQTLERVKRFRNAVTPKTVNASVTLPDTDTERKEPPKPPSGEGGHRKRVRKSLTSDAEVDHVKKSKEVKRLMDDEGLSRAEAMTRVGYS